MADNSHNARITATISRFEEAMSRFESRLASASAEDAERPRADGGWSAAQIAWHVAAVNASFTTILDGSRPVAQPAPPDFIERSWEDIGASLEPKLQAPARVQPGEGVTRDEAVAKLAASRDTLIAALRALDPERARMVIDAPIVGRISLYQVGEWAVVHAMRHNKQMKETLASIDSARNKP